MAAADHSDALVSVSLAIFDTAIGNSIVFTHPTASSPPTGAEGGDNLRSVDPTVYLDGCTPVGVKALHDFCFPDGAHDTMWDVTPFAIRATQQVPQLGNPPDNSTTNPPVVTFFGVGIYHLKRDANVNRGARQRGLLLVTRRPMYQLLIAFAERIVMPLLDIDLKMHIGEDASPDAPRCIISREAERLVLQGLTRKLYDVLHGALTAPTILSPPVTSPADGDREVAEPSVADRSEPWCCTRYEFHLGDPVATFLNKLNVDECVAPFDRMDFVSDIVRTIPRRVVAYGPLPDAPPREAMTHGVELCAFTSRFTVDSIAQLHYALLTRVPLIFLGASGSDVANAVLAVMHLARCLPIHHTRFVPYASIDLMDVLLNTVSCTTFAAVGATNAYVRHKPIRGVIKVILDAEPRQLEFPPGPQGDHHAPLLPKSYTRLWNRIVRETRPEIRLRARVAALNRNIRKEFVMAEGPLYAHLCRRTNIIDSPLHALLPDTLADVQTVVDLTSTANVSEADAACDDGNNDVVRQGSDFLLVNTSLVPDEERLNRLSSPRYVLPPTDERTSTHTDGASIDDEGSQLNSPRCARPCDPRPTAVVLEDDGDVWFGLTSACDAYEHSAKEAEMTLARLRNYHATVLEALCALVKGADERLQEHLDASFGSFDAACGHQGSSTGGYSGAGDLGRFATDSSLIAALNEQHLREEAHIVHLATQVRQRAIDSIELVTRFNDAALRRQANVQLSDLFAALPGCSVYDFGVQPLILSAPCHIDISVSSDAGRSTRRIESSGRVHLFRNYLCFESSALSLGTAKCHQVFPFDHIVELTQRGGRRTCSIKLTMRHVVYPDWVADVTVALDETRAQHSGFFEMLQLLVIRQRRLHDLFAGALTPAGSPHAGSSPPPHAVISEERMRPKVPMPLPPLVCPIACPAALHCSSRLAIADEVYENERWFPVVTWTKRLLPTDPSAPFTDRSGKHARKMNEFPVCPGFIAVSAWHPAPFDGPIICSSVEEALAQPGLDPASPSSWVYGGLQWHSLTNNAVPGGTVRRRRWVRWRRLVESAPPATTDIANRGSPQSDSLRRLNASFVHQFKCPESGGDSSETSPAHHHVRT